MGAAKHDHAKSGGRPRAPPNDQHHRPASPGSPLTKKKQSINPPTNQPSNQSINWTTENNIKIICVNYHRQQMMIWATYRVQQHRGRIRAVRLSDAGLLWEI